MFDQILTWAVIALPTLFAVGLEVISEGLRRSRRWRWGVMVFGVCISVLTGAQIYRSDRSHERELEASRKIQEDLRTKLDSSLLNQQYEQGRLDTMNDLLGKIATNSDPKQTAVLLNGLVSTKNTLKKDTISVCAEFERWAKVWQAKNPSPNVLDPQHATAKEIEAQNAYFQSFSNESFARFGPRLLAIIQRYGAIGVDVRMMEQQMTYSYVPQDLITKLRAFASRINDDGSLKN